MGPLALLPGQHQAGLAQDLHVVRKARLGQGQRFLQFAGTFFPAAQLFQNGQTLGVTQCLEDLGVLLVGIHGLYLTSKFLDV